MPHTAEERRKAITRLRKIRGQAEALERTIADGASCGEVLQQLAAMRGGVNGLVREVLEGHLRETFAAGAQARTRARTDAAIDEVADLLRTYLK